jgi:hypothetical protein
MRTVEKRCDTRIVMRPEVALSAEAGGSGRVYGANRWILSSSRARVALPPLEPRIRSSSSDQIERRPAAAVVLVDVVDFGKRAARRWRSV